MHAQHITLYFTTTVLYKYTVLIRNTLPCQMRAVPVHSRVPTSTRTEFHRYTIQNHRAVKRWLLGRRVIQDQSVKSSVVSKYMTKMAD